MDSLEEKMRNLKGDIVKTITEVHLMRRLKEDEKKNQLIEL